MEHRPGGDREQERDEGQPPKWWQVIVLLVLGLAMQTGFTLYTRSQAKA